MVGIPDGKGQCYAGTLAPSLQSRIHYFLGSLHHRKISKSTKDLRKENPGTRNYVHMLEQVPLDNGMKDFFRVQNPSQMQDIIINATEDAKRTSDKAEIFMRYGMRSRMKH